MQTDCMGAIDSQIQVPTPESVLDTEKDHPPSAGTASLAQALTPWRGHGRRLWLVKVLLLLVDAAVLWGCFVASRAVAWAYHQTGFLQGMVNWWEAYGLVRTQVFAFVSVAAILWLGSVYGHYTVSRRRPWWDETRQLLIVIVFGAMADAMFMYLGKWQFSRLATGSTWVLILVTLPLARLTVQHWLTRLGWLAQPYVLVGAPGPAKEAAAALASERLIVFRRVTLSAYSPNVLPNLCND